MNQGPAELSDQVTVLVFKDNFAARTFQIRPSWITRLGLLLSFIVILTLLSTFFAIKYYRIAAKLDPTRVLDLEQEMGDLKAHLKSQDLKFSEKGLSVLSSQVATPAPHPTLSPESTLSTSTQNSPVILSSVFPSTVRGQLPDPAKLPFSLQAPKAIWKGKTLTVNFALQYDKKDEGHQQGRVVIIARGPGTLLTYPADSLLQSGSEHLISPEKGEYFSVSHYREVSTQFGPAHSTADLREVEVYIFSEEGQVLTYQKFLPQNGSALKQESPKTAPEPQQDTPANSSEGDKT